MNGPFGHGRRSQHHVAPDQGHRRLERCRDPARADRRASAATAARFKQPMARQIYFSKMKDADIDAIVAWVRTMPPLE